MLIHKAPEEQGQSKPPGPQLDMIDDAHVEAVASYPRAEPLVLQPQKVTVKAWFRLFGWSSLAYYAAQLFVAFAYAFDQHQHGATSGSNTTFLLSSFLYPIVLYPPYLASALGSYAMLRWGHKAKSAVSILTGLASAAVMVLYTLSLYPSTIFRELGFMTVAGWMAVWALPSLPFAIVFHSLSTAIIGERKPESSLFRPGSEKKKNNE